MQNLVAEVVGRSPGTIVVMAHRDNDGSGQGANDNASGTAMLVQLARAYGAPAGASSGRLRPNHTILFVSTDGGSAGGLGAAWFASHAPLRRDIAGVINLDAVGGSGRVRVEFNGDTPRNPSGTFLQTIAARISAQTGRPPARPSAVRQLVDLGFPFSLYEQAPFLTHGVAAVTLTTAGDNPPDPLTDTEAGLRADRLGQVGRAAQDALGTLDEGLEFTQGTSSYLYLGSRLIRGWAIELVLLACLLPFLATAVDLFARCRRRHIPLGPALRAYRSRLGFWAWVVGLFELFRLLGAWPDGSGRPISPHSPVAHDWPAKSLLALGVFALAGWLVSRERLIPRRSITAEEELAGHTASLLCLGGLSLLVVATNPFALIFLLPSLHIWLWLPQLRNGRVPVRLGVLVAGLAGPALLFAVFAERFGLGWDTPLFLADLRAVGYVPFIVHAAVGCLARKHGAARGALGRPLRAVSRSLRAPADRAGTQGGTEDGPRNTQPPQAIGCARPQSVGGLDAASSANRGDAAHRRRRAHTCLDAPRLAMAGPVHGALHEVEAAPARVAVPEARRGVLGPDRDHVACRRAPEHCARSEALPRELDPR